MSAAESPNWTVGAYSASTILLLVAPALYAASIYMMLGRIILVTDGEHHSIVPKRWLTKIFVVGDVISFMMQGAGTLYTHFDECTHEERKQANHHGGQAAA